MFHTACSILCGLTCAHFPDHITRNNACSSSHRDLKHYLDCTLHIAGCTQYPYTSLDVDCTLHIAGCTRYPYTSLDVHGTLHIAGCTRYPYTSLDVHGTPSHRWMYTVPYTSLDVHSTPTHRWMYTVPHHIYLNLAHNILSCNLPQQ